MSQLGTEAAVVIYFARDIWRILKAWFNGLFVKAHRDNIDYRMLVRHHRHAADRGDRPGVQGSDPR